MGEELVQQLYQPCQRPRVGEELCGGITTFGLAPPPQIGSGLGEAKFPQVSISQAPKVVQNDPLGDKN